MEALALLFAMVAMLFMAIGPVGLILAIVSLNKQKQLERRIVELGAALAAARKEGAFQRGAREDELPEPADATPAPSPAAPAPSAEPPAPSAELPAPSAEPPAPSAELPAPSAELPAPSPELPAPSPAAPAPRRRPISFGTIAVWALSAPGGLILLVAGYLLFDQAIERGWLGPVVRFTGGIAFGLLAILTAELLWSKRYRLPAAALGGAGLGILYAALYAGHAWYDLMGVPLTFALMALVTATGVTWAVRRNSQFTAVLGLLGGYLTPVLLSTGDNKALALFSYIGLLLTGLLVAAYRRGWWALTGLAGAASAAVLLGWSLKFHSAEQAPVALAAAVILGGLLFTAAWLRETPRAVAWLATAGVLLMQLAILPYLAPVALAEGAGASILPLAMVPWLAAGFLILCAGALQALANRKGWVPLGPIGSLALAPGLLVFSIGWQQGLKPEDIWGGFGPFPEGLGATYGLQALPAVLLPLALLGSALAAWLAAGLVPALPAARQAQATGRLPFRAEHGAAAALVVVGTVVTLLAFEPMSVLGLGLLTVGLLAMGWLLAWAPGPRWMTTAGLGFAALTMLVGTVQDQPGLLGVGAALVAMSLFTPFAVQLSSRGRALTASPLPWLGAALAGPLLFLPMHAGWSETLGDDTIGMLPLALGLGTLVAAVMLRERIREVGPRTLAVFTAVALLFACLAVPVQLRNEWWTVGWALEGAALAWLSRRIRHPGVVGLSLTLLAMVTVRLVFNLEVLGYHTSDGSLINWTLYGYGVPVLALLAAAWWLRPGEDDPRFASPWGWLRAANPAAVLMATAVAFVLINLEVSAAFPEGERWHLWSSTLEASMTRSISWAVFGLLLMLPAQRQQLRYLRPMALLFLLAAALKVFLLDLWQLSGFVRVGSLFGVAITLILAALAFQRLVLRDGDDDEEDSP